jgi:ABC-type multidrug transport system ATPase subunit/ABC-type multidrug transport system permease subunit
MCEDNLNCVARVYDDKLDNDLHICETARLPSFEQLSQEATLSFLAYECGLLQGLSGIFDNGHLFGQCHSWQGEIECHLQFVDIDADERIFSTFECQLEQCSMSSDAAFRGGLETTSGMAIECEDTVCVGSANSDIVNGIVEGVSGKSSLRCSGSKIADDETISCSWDVGGLTPQARDEIQSSCSISRCLRRESTADSPTSHTIDSNSNPDDNGGSIDDEVPHEDISGDGCTDGFSGASCGLCTTGRMCEARFHRPDDASNDKLDLRFDCDRKPLFLSSSSDKSYECKVTNLQALFKGGIAWAQCQLDTDLEKSKCRFEILQQQEEIDGGELLRVMECSVESCKFHQGSAAFDCQDLSCQGFLEQDSLNALIAGLAGSSSFSCKEDSLSSADGTYACTLNVPALPLGPIESSCMVRGCNVELVLADGSGFGLGGAGGEVVAEGSGTPLVSLVVFAMFAMLAGVMIAAGLKVHGLHKKIQRSRTIGQHASKPISHSKKSHVLTFTNVTAVPEGKGRRPILSPPVSGSLLNGQMLALLGPSGSGKTTLLRAMAGVQNPGVEVGGTFLLDGRPFHEDKSRSAFVKQHEILMETLTVRECILFSAFLRMDPDLPVEEKVNMSDAIIEELGLQERTHHLVSKLSGGQRRRVSIGQELVISPSLLLLDEPTSGLDSHTASLLIKFLRTLCTSSNKSDAEEISKDYSTPSGVCTEMDDTAESVVSDGTEREKADEIDADSMEDILFSDDKSSTLELPYFQQQKKSGAASVVPEVPHAVLDVSTSPPPDVGRTVYDPVTNIMTSPNNMKARNGMERHLRKLRKADEDARLLLSREAKSSKAGQRMVIMSIHQPSQSMFVQFDRLMCLSLGQVVYDGMASHSASYMSGLGFDCPRSTPIPDFIMEVISGKHSSALMAQEFQKKRASRDEREIGQTRLTLLEESRTAATPLSVEITVLTWRSLINNWRNSSLFSLSLGLSLCLGLGCGLLFFGVTDDLPGFQNRLGAFYFMLTFFAFASLGSMDTFVSERNLFIHECEAGYFSVGSYFLAKTLLDAILLRVIPSILFSFIFYWLVGLQPDFARFATFLLVLILFNVCTGSQAMVVGLLSKSVGTANVFAVCMFLFQLLFGGFLVNVETLPPYIVWVERLSVFSYAFEALMCNELQGLLLSLRAPGLPPVPIKGEIFLTTLGFHVERIGLDLVLLFVMCSGFFFIAYCILVHHQNSTETKKASRSKGMCGTLIAGTVRVLGYVASILTLLMPCGRNEKVEYGQVREDDYSSDSDDGVEMT